MRTTTDNKLYVSVCKNIILSNLKNGTNKPTIRVSRGKYGKPKHFRTFKHGNITISGDMTKKPMPWGARVWVEIEPKLTGWEKYTKDNWKI